MKYYGLLTYITFSTGCVDFRDIKHLKFTPKNDITKNKNTNEAQVDHFYCGVQRVNLGVTHIKQSEQVQKPLILGGHVKEIGNAKQFKE